MVVCIGSTTSSRFVFRRLRPIHGLVPIIINYKCGFKRHFSVQVIRFFFRLFPHKLPQIIWFFFSDSCRSIFVHGFTVDEKGLKMSKSLGNVTYPKDIIENYNVDTLRWWVAGHLVGQTPLSVKQHLFEESANTISKIRKVLRYLVGYVEKMESTNSSQFNINYDSLSPLDVYILNSLAIFAEKAQYLASNYRFPVYINNITKYVNDDLSAFYIDNIKDRLYSNPPHDNVETMNILFAQFCILNKVLWPIVPHLVEEVWSYHSKKSSFYQHQFTIPSEWHNTKYETVMKIVKQLTGMLRENVSKTTWYFDVIISGTAEQIQELEVTFLIPFFNYPRKNLLFHFLIYF